MFDTLQGTIIAANDAISQHLDRNIQPLKRQCVAWGSRRGTKGAIWDAARVGQIGDGHGEWNGMPPS